MSLKNTQNSLFGHYKGLLQDGPILSANANSGRKIQRNRVLSFQKYEKVNSCSYQCYYIFCNSSPETVIKSIQACMKYYDMENGF